MSGRLLSHTILLGRSVLSVSEGHNPLSSLFFLGNEAQRVNGLLNENDSSSQPLLNQLHVIGF